MNIEIDGLIGLLSLVPPIAAAILSAYALIRVQKIQRTSRKDETPEDRNRQSEIANNLILQLLDRANSEVERLNHIISQLTEQADAQRVAAAMVPTLQSDLIAAEKERDKLRKAITFLHEKARVVGQISYMDVLTWASMALNPAVDADAFDVSIASALPDGLEDTIEPR